jgi:hypothetical protein
MSGSFTFILRSRIGSALCWASVIIISFGACATSASAQDYTSLVGGSGGGQFDHPCPANQNLAGVELRVADDVDAIHPVCVSSYSATYRSDPVLTTGSGLVDTTTLTPGWHGGPGGHIIALICPQNVPIVRGMDIEIEGENTLIVNAIALYCGSASAQPGGNIPSVSFKGPEAKVGKPVFGGFKNGAVTMGIRCPASEVAIGIHGRSGIWLDALGLICGPARIDTSRKPPVSLGSRVPYDPNRPLPPICDAAAQARANNSPAAASLERQCFNDHSGVSLGRPGRTDGSGGLASGTPMAICDAARKARDNKSPAAPELARMCIASGGTLDGPKPPVSSLMPPRRRDAPRRPRNTAADDDVRSPRR